MEARKIALRAEERLFITPKELVTRERNTYCHTVDVCPVPLTKCYTICKKGDSEEADLTFLKVTLEGKKTPR